MGGGGSRPDARASVRESKFDRMLKEIAPLHTTRLRALPLRQRSELQLDIFGGDIPTQQNLMTASEYYGATFEIGKFFEKGDTKIFGGQRTNHAVVFYDGRPASIRPDIVDVPHRQMREVKASERTGYAKMPDDQIRKMLELQKQYPDFSFFYDFYVYDAPHVLKAGSDDELNAQLRNTKSNFRLPLSVVELLPSADEKIIINKAERRTRNGLYRQHYKFTKSAEHALHTDPLSVIAELGLPSERFFVNRELSPSRVCVDGVTIRTFPVITVVDRGYDEWRYQHCNKTPDWTRPTRAIADLSASPLFARTIEELEHDAIAQEYALPEYSGPSDPDMPF